MRISGAGHATVFLFLYVALSGRNFISYFDQMRMQLVSVFCGNAVQVAIAAIAFDRLLMVAAPIKHMELASRPYYLASLIIPCFAFGTYSAVVGYNFAALHSDKPSTGTIGDLYVGVMEDVLTWGILISNAFTILFYALLWLRLRIRKSTSSKLSGDKSAGGVVHIYEKAKVLRSVGIIVAIVVSGYVGLAIVRFLAIGLFPNNELGLWALANWYGAIGLNGAAAANATVLCITSSLYRKAFHQYFPFVFGQRKDGKASKALVR